MKLVIALAFVVLCAAGCDTNKSVPLAPEQDRGGPGLSFKAHTIYTKCGTFIASYSDDFVGPIPAGYCRVSDTQATLCSASIGDRLAGDPTDTMDAAGDSDGADQKARSIGDPDSPEAGDPTSDD